MDPTYVPNPNAADYQDGVAVITSSSNIFPFEGDPNGFVMATGPALVLGINSTIGNAWFKTTPGTSNSDWFPVL